MGAEHNDLVGFGFIGTGDFADDVEGVEVVVVELVLDVHQHGDGDFLFEHANDAAVVFVSDGDTAWSRILRFVAVATLLDENCAVIAAGRLDPSGDAFLEEEPLYLELEIALGTELRFQNGTLSASGILDYDLALRGLNIASVQGTWQLPDSTVVNMLYDRRATPMLMLGNSLFFQNPALTVQASRLQDLLASQSLALLRQQVRDVTAYSTQAMLGVTNPVSEKWQVGGDVRLTNIGELLPVADILPNGQPGTGNVWSVGGQLIGSNLYSARDTHVLVLNLLKAPTYKGTLMSYNNSSALSTGWQLEPSLRYFRQVDSDSTRTRRWAPGLRVTYRPTPKLALESELSMEFSDIQGPTRTESSRRTFYYLGLRYDL